ncbi:FtsW/RodA/SpoVE family cell cycle protein [Hoyosella subflava]|uniref:Cell division protein n=1 Tax=Hoyosella subflava (strain DSM 45089 / JCM 17490 / NBRC 109087 / DQS3-9A1) TaxID=443218 RepID=F6EJS8_HOYSD|nr:FtsW/RodA/SpoVE family cell cycle protein [Hoyosella subflava]AEF40103.1 Cell division protein [Hoyosella subflava DQS3-9A1]
MHQGERKNASDPLLVGSAAVLVLFGLLNLLTLGMDTTALRHAVFAVVGFVLVFALSRIKLADLTLLAWSLYGAAVGLLLAVPVVGVTVKGAQRWLELGPISMQPADLAKLAVVLAIATVLGRGYRPWRLVIALGVACVPIGLVAMQPDLSTALVLGATSVMLLILGRVPLLPLLPLFGIGIAAVPLAVLALRPYQLERIQVFLSGDHDPAGSGWAAVQAEIAIGAGGLFGLASDPLYPLRASYVPEREHDLAFVSLVYAWGLLAGLAVILALLIVVWRCALAARVARTPQGALIASGVAVLFGVHGLVSVAANLSLLPHTGLPIPLFSYGGSVMTVHLAAIGLVLAVRRDGVRRPLWIPPGKAHPQPRGARAGALVVSALLIVMSGFIWELQNNRGDELLALSDAQMTRCIRIPAERGVILDRNGVPLATNSHEYRVQVVPGMFSAHDVDGLAALVETPPDELTEMISARGEELSASAGAVGAARAQEIIDAGLPGVLVIPSGDREYPHGEILGQILGFVRIGGTDDLERWPELALGAVVGAAGIERQYDALLRGVDGRQCLFVDPAGLPVAPAERIDPVHGHDLRLHLDLEMQRLATQSLTDAIRTNGGDLGAAQVMDARTGAVLAMASVPGFDNNVYSPPADLGAIQSLADAPGHPMLNKVTQIAGPPGSTFKIVVAAANAHYQALSPAYIMPTGAAYVYGGHTFRNWQPMGPHNLVQALQWSDNVYFYRLGVMLGPDRMAEVARSLGVGERSGIDLPGEISGFLGTPETVARIGGTWYGGSTVLMGIGQGTVSVTPMQVARWTAGISTGAMVTPRIADAYGTDEYIRLPAPAPQRLAFADSLGPVRAGMRAAVTGGTAGQLADLPISSAAKTGTAEDPSAPGKGTNAWFSAVAPYEEPEIVVTAFVRGGGFGSAASGPVVKDLLQFYADNWHASAPPGLP